MKLVVGNIQYGSKEAEETFGDHEENIESHPISRYIEGKPSHKQKVWKIMESHPKAFLMKKLKLTKLNS